MVTHYSNDKMLSTIIHDINGRPIGSGTLFINGYSDELIFLASTR